MIEKEDKTENCALRDSRLYRDLVRGLAFQSDNLHTPLGEEGCEPDAVERPPDTIVVELVKEFLVWHHVEGLTKAEDGYVDFVRVPGETKRSRDLRGGRWSWTLTFAQKRSWVGRWRWALSKLDVFCFELSKLFVNSGATDIVLVTLSSTAVERAIAQCTSRWAMARGHRLNWHFHCSGGGPRSLRSFSGGFRGRANHPGPFPTLSPSLIGYPASVDVKQHKNKMSTCPSIKGHEDAMN